MPPANEAEDDLNRLEQDIRQFKVECEQYFGGGRKRPPNETEWRIESMLKRYGEREAELSYRYRFRFTNLLQSYAKFKDVYRKRLQRREAGSVARHFGAAARTIEAERANRRKAETTAGIAVTCTDPAREGRKLEQIYTAYRDAIERTGESAAQLSSANFKQFLHLKAEQLRKQKGAQAVEFVVSIERGKAKLKARVCATDAGGDSKAADKPRAG